MKLHWSPGSPYVRKVMILAHETGLAPRIECIPTTVAMSEPNRDLMRESPLGKIPVLVSDEGQILFDSIVICEYLDGLQAGTNLFPPPGDARWQALRWHALGDGVLDTLVQWRNECKQAAAQQNPDWLAAFQLKIRNSLDMIEHEARDLERAPFSIRHIALACALGYLDFRFPGHRSRDLHPRGAAWFEEISRRASVKLTRPRPQ